MTNYYVDPQDRPFTPSIKPAPQPEPDDELEEQKQTEQESKPGWDWVGSPSRPEAQEHSDGISDLFTVTDEDLDAGEGVDDLVTVDIEKDIMDADEDTSDLSDLVDVFDEDIMGVNDIGQPPSQKYLSNKRRAGRQPIRYIPPTRYIPSTSIRGLR